MIYQNPPPQLTKTPTIIDIGPGNGVLIAEIIKEMLPIYVFDQINLILIDQSSEMLKAATKHCQDNIPVSLNSMPICAPIEAINKEQLAAIQEKHSLWFINAAASLHHLPRETKLATLKNLQTLDVPCLITEGQGNHDKPEKNSPELIYSVTEFYGFFIQDIFNCNVSEEEKKICLYNLALTEAINILKNDRQHRGDYQALIPEWQEIAEQAGFKQIKTTATVSLPNSPLLFTMEIDPKS